MRHEARLRAFIGRLAGPAIGDELAQEAFLRAWTHARDYRGEGRYASWLTGIGWRLFLDHHKREARRQRLTLAAPEASEHDTRDPGARLDLERLLAQLDPRECAALILCDGHGWSHSEAADILAIPLGTLKSLVARAKAKLQAHIEGSAPP